MASPIDVVIVQYAVRQDLWKLNALAAKQIDQLQHTVKADGQKWREEYGHLFPPESPGAVISKPVKSQKAIEGVIREIEMSREESRALKDLLKSWRFNLE